MWEPQTGCARGLGFTRLIKYVVVTGRGRWRRRWRETRGKRETKDVGGVIDVIGGKSRRRNERNLRKGWGCHIGDK